MDPNLSLSVITNAEDEDLSFIDLRDNQCESKKSSAALKQFNFFLGKYCISKGYDPVTAEQIPHDGLDGIHGDFNREKWWSDIIGNFFNYLAFDASKYCKKDKGLLAYDTATGYASAVKVFFVDHFRNRQPPLVFSNPSWRKLRNLLLTKFKERAKRTGQRINNPKVASTTDDRKAMANACFWLGTADAAEFHGLNTSTFHLCGRGGEVSTLKPEDLSVSYIEDMSLAYYVISVSIQRDKDGPLQELTLYPHRQSLQEDPYFGLVYSLLVGGCNNPSLFPKFCQEATIVNKHQKTESRVSTFWTVCFNSLYKEFKSLSEQVSNELTCYHGRKGANQKLAEIKSVSGLAQIFRTGWELRGFHSIFDYVIGSKNLTNQAGKALSGWTSSGQDSDIIGGVPPMLSSIRSNPGQVNDFIMVLFSNDVEERWPTTIRNSLVASLLRHYDDFILAISQHPNELYNDPSRHPLVHSIRNTQRITQVSDTTLVAWCKEIKEGFATNNFMALPIQCLPSETKIDPRSLYDRFNHICSAYNGLFTQKMALEDNVSRLRLDVTNSLQQIHLMRQTIEDQSEILRRITNVLEIKFSKPTEPSQELSQNETVMYFSDTMKRWRRDSSMKEQFIRFFTDQCIRGYELEKNSMSFKAKLPNERSKIKNQYKRLKRTIKTMLYFCDEYPGSPPEDPTHLITWQRKLTLLAEQVFKDMEKALPVSSSRVTQAALTKAEIVKVWDTTKQPPVNTPDEIIVHFGYPNN